MTQQSSIGFGFRRWEASFRNGLETRLEPAVNDFLKKSRHDSGLE